MAVAVLIVLTSTIVGAESASAASYARSIAAPQLENGQIVARANTSTNCEGTFGCWTYIKVERLNTRVGVFTHPWTFVSGPWAHEGDNVVTAAAEGCAVYRTVVDSYNDAQSNISAGINLGVAQGQVGGNVKTYHKSFIAVSDTICNYA